ncbi:MAG: hypothetical protein WKF82_06195 [Nocardioidaceae bacterium]
MPCLVVLLIPLLGEDAVEVPVGVDVDEFAENVVVDLGAGVDRRGRRVERVRLTGQSGVQEAACFGSTCSRRAAG